MTPSCERRNEDIWVLRNVLKGETEVNAGFETLWAWQQTTGPPAGE